MSSVRDVVTAAGHAAHDRFRRSRRRALAGRVRPAVDGRRRRRVDVGRVSGHAVVAARRAWRTSSARSALGYAVTVGVEEHDDRPLPARATNRSPFGAKAICRALGTPDAKRIRQKWASAVHASTRAAVGTPAQVSPTGPPPPVPAPPLPVPTPPDPAPVVPPLPAPTTAPLPPPAPVDAGASPAPPFSLHPHAAHDASTAQVKLAKNRITPPLGALASRRGPSTRSLAQGAPQASHSPRLLRSGSEGKGGSAGIITLTFVGPAAAMSSMCAAKRLIEARSSKL